MILLLVFPIVLVGLSILAYIYLHDQDDDPALYRLDAARMARDAAQAQHDEAEAQLTELINGPARRRSPPRAALAAAKAELALAQSGLDNTRLSRRWMA